MSKFALGLFVCYVFWAGGNILGPAARADAKILLDSPKSQIAIGMSISQIERILPKQKNYVIFGGVNSLMADYQDAKIFIKYQSIEGPPGNWTLIAISITKY